MSVPGGTTSDSAFFARWRRDYRISLLIVLVGIVLGVALAAFSLWAQSTGHAPTTLGSALIFRALVTASGMLVLLGGTVAYYHWHGIRQWENEV